MHWTYRRAPARSDLEQGDILLPTTKLRTLFRRVHPHFDDPKYLGFVVTTQTCDLVRRGKHLTCDAQYISVAVIRPLEQVLFDLLGEVCAPVANGAYRASDRGKAKDLLQRIFNQNEWKLGVFYLHPDADLGRRPSENEPSGFGDSGVCLLRVSVALLRKHYTVLRAARCGRLRSEFSDKLGWIVGNLYSRIATPDWSDSPNGDSELGALLDDFLGASGSSNRPIWLSDDQLSALSREGVDLQVVSRRELMERLTSLSIETSVDRAVREVARDIKSVAPNFPDDQVEKICNRLRNNGKFKKALRG